MEYSSAQLKKTIIVLGIRTVIILAVAIGLRIFFGGLIVKESKALYNERTLSNIILQRQANTDKLSQDFNAVKDDVVNMEAIMPSERRIFEVTHLFESLAKGLGGSASITFSDPENTGGTLVQMPFHFVVSGNVDFLANYLKRLENLPYGIKFLSFNLSGPAGIYNGGEARVEALVMFRPE